jgi:hypothetical protein
MQKLVAEAEDTSGTQRKGNISGWMALQSNSSENVTADINV